ncbi:ATP-binding protein [Actinomadura chibensis]|nr:ATP-binding protein [Actinomadura chibensis]
MTVTVTSQVSICHYPAKPTVVGMARDHTSAALRDWRAPVSVDDAVLVVSELVTNAIRISGSTDRVTLRLQWIGHGLVLGVWDGSTEMPTVDTTGDPTLDEIDPDPAALGCGDDRMGGWGLPLVRALTVAFQVERTYSPIGKWVTALLPVRGHGDKVAAASNLRRSP